MALLPAVLCTCQTLTLLILVSVPSRAFILNGITLSPLSQFATYGKSMVLVGGNLQDNNSEVYNTIVEMAVSGVDLICQFISINNAIFSRH